jgi:RNA:NAD 2'-phosphotransferase (TPT1/KptA family)
MEDGIKFYKSKNNVILTEETIPPKNIKLITCK